MNVGALQLGRLDACVLPRHDVEDFSERAPSWALATARLPVEIDGGRSVDDVLGGAEKKTSEFSHSEVKRQAADVLQRLRHALESFDLGTVPVLKAYESEDRSATIEWRFPDRRFAFTIEPNEEESAWHLVSSEASGNMFAVGRFDRLDLRRVLSLAFAQDPR